MNHCIKVSYELYKKAEDVIVEEIGKTKYKNDIFKLQKLIHKQIDEWAKIGSNINPKILIDKGGLCF